MSSKLDLLCRIDAFKFDFNGLAQVFQFEGDDVESRDTLTVYIELATNTYKSICLDIQNQLRSRVMHNIPLADFQAVLQLHHDKYSKALADLYLKQEMTPEDRILLEDICKETPEHINTLLNNQINNVISCDICSKQNQDKEASPDVLLELGDYYHMHQSEGYKYFLLAIEKGSTKAMVKLASYHKARGESESMIKYYLMAIEKGNNDIQIEALLGLGDYYKAHVPKRYNSDDSYQLMKKYYSMALAKGGQCAKHSLLNYYSAGSKFPMIDKLRFMYEIGELRQKDFNGVKMDSDMLKFISELDTTKVKLQPDGWLATLRRLLNEKINLLELHFNYSPGAEGFNVAKSDFYDQVSIAI